jgi:hypothetical protein
MTHSISANGNNHAVLPSWDDMLDNTGSQSWPVARDTVVQIIADLLAGKEPNGVRADQCGQWTDHIRRLYDAYSTGGTEAVQRLSTALANSDPDYAELITLNDGPLPWPEHIGDCPPLPSEVEFDLESGRSVASWLNTYIEYASAVSPKSPASFHESAALWLASLAIARRLVVKVPWTSIYPNLFIAWIAPTTLWAKTTSMELARGLAFQAFPHLLAPQDATHESLISDMAGSPPTNWDDLSVVEQALWQQSTDFAAQKGWILDEMSGLLAGAGKDYNAGQLEMLMRLYDCDHRFERSTRGQGRIIVKRAYLSFLGASTPSMLGPHLRALRLWSNGWWPRFALLTPEGEPRWVPARAVDRPESLLTTIKTLYERLPKPEGGTPNIVHSVQLGESVYPAWERYVKACQFDLLTTYDVDERLAGSYARLPTQAMKIAIILAALDWREDGSNAPVITMPHMARAVEITERWRASVHRVLSQVEEQQAGQLRDQILLKIAQYEPRGATLRDLTRAIKTDSKTVAFELEHLVKDGQAQKIEARPGPKGGRPTERYRLAGS